MRLRLSVQRNNLPTSNILWNVPDNNSPQAYTIARLLDDVNLVFPLESEQWGLEDYTVEVGGFECLHFAPVFQTLKDDDMVSIRPLLTAEVRSRTLCGRLQISNDGRHLLDGVSFGRPLLRQPSRPAVKIPPRKRRRIEDDTLTGADEDNNIDVDNPMLQISDREHDDQPHPNKSNAAKKVHFSELSAVDSESSEEDEDFAPSDEDSDPDSSVDEASDAESVNSEASSDASSTDESDSESSSSDSDSDEESLIASTETATRGGGQPSREDVPPGKGSKETKKRNARRLAVSKLKKLRETGELSQNATLKDLRVFLSKSGNNSAEHVQLHPAHPMASFEGTRQLLDDSTDEVAELEERKRAILAKFDEVSKPESSQTVNPDTNGASESAVSRSDTVDAIDTVEIPVTRPDTPPDVLPSNLNPVEPRPTKRVRPDTAAIGRILARQTKNPEKKKATRAKEVTPEPEGANEPDFWKSRVSLSAFECWEEAHELSAPPFPFEQHWDPASQLMREQMNKNKKKGRKRKRSPVIEEHQEVEEEDEDEVERILNYDDSADTSKQDSDQTAVVESQILLDVEVAAQSDLPPLPVDPESLPPLQKSDIQVGAVVAFKLWVIDPETITPEITGYKTAKVEKEGDSGSGAGQFRLKLAARDVLRQGKKENKSGDREETARNPFKNFQTVETDEGEEDVSVWEGTFSELVEPRLVRAAEL
ncbi:unnamed protein product [Periconia digitata]|uniref:DUF7357 domain-containing protein n=1 Tax=Periconia digitata TaxID=1303443 RepID=A0A9W4UR58_9PLEO|nr:unnamed protein product [Periconia digitata]